MSITPTFTGEVQLAGCNWSHNSGSKITFWLPDDSQLDVFRDLTAKKGKQAGHRFMCVLVEIGDDELPIEPSPAQEIEPKTKAGELCIMACNFCKDPLFLKWLGVADEHTARLRILELCQCASRKDLDSDPYFANLFHAYVRSPFMLWKWKREE